MNACSVPFVVAKLKQLTKPGVVVLCLLHHLGALLPLVRLRFLLVVLERLAHHHDVLASPDVVTHQDLDASSRTNLNGSG